MNKNEVSEQMRRNMKSVFLNLRVGAIIIAGEIG